MCVVALIDLPCARGERRTPQAIAAARPTDVAASRSPTRPRSRASTSTTGSSARRAPARRSTSRRAPGPRLQHGGAGADPLLRRARPRVRRPAPRASSTSTRSPTRRWREREALLHRAARRAQPAGARRDLLQLGDQADPAAQLLRQRAHLRPRGDLDRVHRARPADLPQLLPERRRRAASASRSSSATSAGAGRSPTSTATSTTCCARSTSGRADAWTHLEPNYQIQVLSSAFYRNKAAYVVGKLVNGHDELPFVVPVLHDGGRPARARRDPARAASRSTSSSRSRAPTSWSTWRCRPATSSSCAR